MLFFWKTRYKSVTYGSGEFRGGDSGGDSGACFRGDSAPGFAYYLCNFAQGFVPVCGPENLSWREYAPEFLH